MPVGGVGVARYSRAPVGLHAWLFFTRSPFFSFFTLPCAATLASPHPSVSAIVFTPTGGQHAFHVRRAHESDGHTVHRHAVWVYG